MRGGTGWNPCRPNGFPRKKELALRVHSYNDGRCWIYSANIGAGSMAGHSGGSVVQDEAALKTDKFLLMVHARLRKAKKRETSSKAPGPSQWHCTRQR
jgi:hypothetical protein